MSLLTSYIDAYKKAYPLGDCQTAKLSIAELSNLVSKKQFDALKGCSDCYVEAEAMKVVLNSHNASLKYNNCDYEDEKTRYTSMASLMNEQYRKYDILVNEQYEKNKKTALLIGAGIIIIGTIMIFRK